MKVKAVWQFFEAEAEGEALHCYGWRRSALHTWKLKRQRTGDRLCFKRLCAAAKDGKRDHVAHSW